MLHRALRLLEQIEMHLCLHLAMWGKRALQLALGNVKALRDEVCEPECESPVCQTRCSGYDLSACHMECDKPHCSVLCPQHLCPMQHCPACSTQCSEPMCQLICPYRQPCRNLCENPRCNWKCRAPLDCPKPKCQMVCEMPRNCAGSTYQKLPPLMPGETAVQSFAAPIGFKERTANEKEMIALLRVINSTSHGRYVAPKEVQQSKIAVPVLTVDRDASSSWIPPNPLGFKWSAASAANAQTRSLQIPVEIGSRSN